MDSLAALSCVGFGIAWRFFRWLPPADRIRRGVSTAVFYVLLPLLTFRSMAHAPLDRSLWQVPLVAAITIVSAVGCAYAWLRHHKHWGPPERSALLLASAWGNVTYLGIPVLSALVGSEQLFVAVLFDFAASTPLLWTLGVALALAETSESQSSPQRSWNRILLLPPLWAALVGLLWRISDAQLDPSADQFLALGAGTVIPLMMFVLGLSLRWEYLRRWKVLMPLATIKLAIAPMVALGVALALGIRGSTLQAVTLEAAMPTMMLVLVVAERFGLTTELVAAAIAVTTLASAVSLPVWWLISSMLP